MQLGQVVGVHRLLDLGDALEAILDEFLNKNAWLPISSSSFKVWMLIAGRLADGSGEGREDTRVRSPLMATLMRFLARTMPVSKQVNPAFISRTKMVQVSIQVTG